VLESWSVVNFASASRSRSILDYTQIGTDKGPPEHVRDDKTPPTIDHLGTSSSPCTEHHFSRFCNPTRKSRAFAQRRGMGDARLSSEAPSPNSTAKSNAGRQRLISSCLTCRRRKVKCDHVHPICGACSRGGHLCTWTDQTPTQTVTGRISKPPITGSAKIAKNGDVQSRLDRLELLLEKAVSGLGVIPQASVRSSADLERRDHDAQTPSSNSQTLIGQGMASDDGDGTLLLDGGRSQFVSTLHFALLAEEVSRPYEDSSLR
jgi:hypothetical protein